MSKLVCFIALAVVIMTAGTGLAGYVCEYSNSDGTGNDATNRCTGIAVLSEDNFVMSINRDSVPYYALCKWTNATATAGRGSDVTQWYYSFDTVNMDYPYGLAADASGNVYVCNNDPDNNILVFDGNLADPVATQYRLATAAGDTIYTIDVDAEGFVYVGLCNAETDRVDVYPPVTDNMWTTHTGNPMTTISLPDGIYAGMCVNTPGTEVYVSEYTGGNISRYTGSPGAGFTLDGGFSFTVDSLATAIDIDDSGYLYIAQDHWVANPFEYSNFWVVDVSTGAVTDQVNMALGGATPTSAGWYSAMDLEVDDAGNVYVVHYYAWAVEKWIGSPSTGVDIVHSGSQLPRESVLVQNYPNPFNASTEIRYALPQDARVKLEVFNVSGQRVAGLVDTDQPAGQYQLDWNAGQLPSGIYFVRLQAGAEMAVSKMALVR
ncbi:T9SS type A sorting domain-containing protein [Candidatus Zixiibacteriota bacterium]